MGDSGYFTRSMSVSRRSFLRGRLRVDSNVLRPPWAVIESAFEGACTRCGDCLKVCPTAILVVGDGGFPTVDFHHGECSFCGDCVAACPTGALQRHSQDGGPWSLRAAIGDACLARSGVECRVCGEACDEAAIRFRPTRGGVAQPQLDAARCTGCGACYAPCPVEAIALTKNVEMQE